MKQFIIVLLLVSAFTYSCKEEAIEATVKIVTAEEMKELSKLEDVQLLDVRTPEEYAIGYIDGFKNIDFLSDTFQEDIEKLDKTKPVIVYCKSGNRSGRCSALMLEKGFKKIYDLEGGITKWESEGNPIKKDSE
jgi:rhodanese-related sulfurtransferase